MWWSLIGCAWDAELEPAVSEPTVGRGDPQPHIATAGVPDPMAGLTATEMCRSSTLMLVKYRFDELEADKCHDVCCTLDETHWCCESHWPFPESEPCSAYAELRNGLFARYGYPFEEPEWRRRFEGEPFYRRRDDFEPGWMSSVARGNVETLKRLEAEQVGCSP